ncbi:MULTISPECIES: MarR family winged helix-turn-helix transcriptional regulator [Kitasatospora]|uniref:MarR family transcriptional regulator n=1 Tax=Kitasatospora cystarginea TaxID=58350 RepID=A0ABN3E177_9ACTN
MAEEREQPDEVLECLIEELGQAMQDFQRSNDTLDQQAADRLGLNRTDMHCLDLLFGSTPMSPGELASAAGLTTGGVTTAIDRLERSGYAARTRDTADRRRVIVQPTEKARTLVWEIYGPIVTEGEAYLRNLGVEDIHRITEFLRFTTEQQREHAARLAERG